MESFIYIMHLNKTEKYWFWIRGTEKYTLLYKAQIQYIHNIQYICGIKISWDRVSRKKKSKKTP